METQTQDTLEALRERAAAGDRLKELVNSPEIDDFLRAVHVEAVHQIERWGTAHDRAKRPADWYWLIGYLGGKALHASIEGDIEKSLHHCISTAAAAYNWHCAIKGVDVTSLPGRSDLAAAVNAAFPGEAPEAREEDDDIPSIGSADALLCCVPESIHDNPWVQSAVAKLRLVARLESRLCQPNIYVSAMCSFGVKGCAEKHDASPPPPADMASLPPNMVTALQAAVKSFESGDTSLVPLDAEVFNDHDRAIIADLEAMAASQTGFWPTSLAHAALRLIRRNDPRIATAAFLTTKLEAENARLVKVLATLMPQAPVDNDDVEWARGVLASTETP
jgi:hypothetical protein